MKHFQESTLEFRLEVGHKTFGYPVIRGVIVHSYGGTMEECLKNAREQLKLGPEWKVCTWSEP